MKRIVFMFMAVFITIINKVEASDSEYWESRFQTILSCNSKSGGAISEVKITNIQSVPNKSTLKVIGNYRQALPMVASFKNIGTNNFSEFTGTFQAFVEGETVLKARYKISIIRGFVKEKCIKSNPSGFDF